MTSEITAVATVHAPFITGRPDLAPQARKKRVDEGFDRLRAHLDSARPDVIVAFSNEHITNFVPSNVPSYCVGVGQSNPTLPEFQLPQADVPGAPGLARELVSYAYDHSFDLSYSEELLLDHGTGLPLSYLTPGYKVPVIVILQNVIFSPMPTLERSYQLGRLVGGFLREETQGLSACVLGTGGISHWVGNEHHGDVNAEFDDWFLDRIRHGDLAALRSITAGQLAAAGDGAHEIRNWLATAAAAEGLRPEVVLDETFIPGWNTSAYQVIWQ